MVKIAHHSEKMCPDHSLSSCRECPLKIGFTVVLTFDGNMMDLDDIIIM